MAGLRLDRVAYSIHAHAHGQVEWSDYTPEPPGAPHPRHRRRAHDRDVAEGCHRAVAGGRGFEVNAATSAAQGEAYYRNIDPSVVLLDLVLPDIDGIALLRQLKAIDEAPEMIVISGVGTITRALEAGQAGAFFFIEKSNLDPAGHRLDPRSRHRPAGRARAARAAEGAGARPVRVLEHHRQEQEDARALRAGRRGGRERRQHPDPGRERRRQGADRQRDPRAQRPRQGAVHQDQLRGAAEGPDRVGAVRLQEGRVHRRDHRQGRACSSWPPAAR